MANKRIKDLATTKYKGFMALDDADGTGKMDVDTIFNNFAGKFVDNVTEAKAGKFYMHNGSLYKAKEDYTGVWDESKFVAKSVEEAFGRRDVQDSLVDAIYNGGALDVQGITLGEVTTGYYYNNSGMLVENANSSYASATLTSSAEGKKLKVTTSANAVDSRCILICYPENNIIAAKKLGDIALLGGSFTFSEPLHEGYVIKASWYTGDGAPTFVEFTAVPSIYFSLENNAADIIQLDKDVNGYEDSVSVIPTSSPTTGYYYDVSGNLVANANSEYKDFIFTSGEAGKILKVSVNELVSLSSARYILLYNSSSILVEYVSLGHVASLPGKTYIFTGIPQSGWVLKMSWGVSDGAPYIRTSNEVKSLDEKIEGVSGEVDELARAVSGVEKVVQFDLSSPTIGKYYDASGNLITKAGSEYKDILITSDNFGKTRVTVSDLVTANNGRYILLCDDLGNIKESVSLGAIVSRPNKTYEFTTVSRPGWVLKTSWASVDGVPECSSVLVWLSVVDLGRGPVMKVSTSGDDNWDGVTLPKKTINSAISSGAAVILIAEGDYDFEDIDLSKAKFDNIVIKGETGKKIIIRRSSAKLLSDGSETLVDGTTKVYSATTSNPSYTGSSQWLFFDGLDESDTAISPTDAHPLQRGKFYRNDCTRIYKCSADNLSDAISEIEDATYHKWYYDTDSGKLYFNRTAATSTYPIYKGTSGGYLVTKDNQSVTMSNVEFRYGCLNLRRLNIVNLYNIAVKYPRNDCFSYDNTVSIRFERCEASCGNNGANGDGFNGHAYGISDDSVKACSATLVDCWSHDNLDDGYSDHEYAETTIEGGLFEYNGKGGVTPSYGSHCICRNVYARHNFNGFYYTGGPNDNGNGGQVICYGCVSESNTRRNTSTDAGYRVDGNESIANRMILVNCKSIGNNTDFVCRSPSVMTLIDCGVSGTLVAQFDGSGFTKVKTMIVE